MISRRRTITISTILAGQALLAAFLPSGAQAQQSRPSVLEEVIVTARKIDRSLQDESVAISVLNGAQLEMLGVSSLDGLIGGIVPSLRIQPFGNAPSTLIVTIRGNGPPDIGQVTRDGSVGVYVDGFLLGRAQGLAMELVDLERIEVLRGPQGTMFGRNATGGVINVISKKPTGVFGLEQTIGYGRFDEFRNVTRVNLPEFSGMRAKIDYIHSERDGWVDNTAPGEADFNALNKDALRVSLNWRPSDVLEFDYSFDYADTSASQLYFQLALDNIGLIGVEPGRQRQTRFPVMPLEPTVTEHRMHALTATWSISDNFSIKSLTSYRELQEDTNNNYAGALYFNGLIFAEDVEQDQWSQEVQLLGSSASIEWIGGLYYFEEDVRAVTENLFSLDIFGFLTGTPLTPIVPPTNFDIFSGGPIPTRIVDARAKSLALYGHATWTPGILAERLHVGLGLRYTDDQRSGSRTDLATTSFDLSTNHFDPSISVAYDWSEGLSTYAKWSTGYKAGGVSPRSASFLPYQEEEAETFEIGIKSEFWGKRARLNAALFATDYKGLQIDFANPINISIIETINAANKVEVDGLEVDLSLVPVPGLVIGLSYTYLDGRIPLQPNPLAGGALEQFALIQTPEHAGSLTIDYTFEPWSLGTLTAHLDVTTTDKYAFVAARSDDEFLDAYTLINGRLTLADIAVGSNAGRAKASLWVKNVADTEYVVFGFPLGDPPIGVTQAFGTPRTFGFDVTYDF